MTDYRLRIWRCQTCEKWSHAKKQPKKHQRWVVPGNPEYSWEFDETRGGADDPAGHFVDCGPFAAWFAERVS